MKDADLREEVVSRAQIYKGHILDVQNWTVTLPDGSASNREVVLHRGASAVVPVDAKGNVYLVRQFRAAVGRVMLEIPAGKLDSAQEDRLEAAKRELREETGLSAKKWTHLGDIATTPGFSSEVISLYLAQELSAGDSAPDADEFLEGVRLPFEQAYKQALEGALQDSKSIIALLRAKAAMDKAELKDV